MLKAFLDTELFISKLEEVSGIPESSLHEKDPEALKFERVLRAKNMEEIEDISLEEIDSMIINLGSLLATINFSSTFLEEMGALVMKKRIPTVQLSRRVL